MKRYAVISFIVLFVACICSPFANASATLGVYGDTVVVTSGPYDPPQNLPAAYQLTSSTTSGLGYSGVFWTAPSGFTLSQLLTLSADFDMTQGAFGGGAPRFSLIDSSSNEAWLYWGTNSSSCGGAATPNGWNNTGNLASASNTNLYVASNGFGGDHNPNTCVTFSSFVSAAGGTTAIKYITIDLDGGFAGKQQMLLDNIDINGNIYDAPTPEPASFILMGAGLLGLAVLVGKKFAVKSV